MGKEPSEPTIYPPSGVYRPPLSVTVTAPLDQGDKLYYIVEEAQLGSEIPSVRKRLYTEPFLLSSAGRVRVSAFIWRLGFGESNSASNIFLLDEVAKPSAPRSGVVPSALVLPQSKAKPTEKSCRVSFARVPEEIRSLEQFSVDVELEDEAGFRCAASYDHPTKVVLSAEILGEATTHQTVVDVSWRQDSKRVLPPPFVQTSNMLVTNRAVRNGSCSDLGRSGKGGAWNAFADSTGCISSSLTACSSVVFRVQCLSRVIVGLHLGLEDVASELSWRALPYSFHFSADLSDPSTVPAFRIYESGKLVEEAGTEEFAVGDEFSIRLRPNGDVAYFHNGLLLLSSPNPSSNASVFSVHVRIASQMDEEAISSMSIVADGEPFSATIDNLLWKPIASAMEKQQHLVLRAWIAGTDYIPAVARVQLRTNSLPRWAFAAMSLASMFALGVAGSQSSHVATVLGEGHQNQPALAVVPCQAQLTKSSGADDRTSRVSVGTENFF